jgi:hypothetical protein
MATFAKRANVVYRLSFADQVKQASVPVFVGSKQTEVCRFRLQQTNWSCRFLLVPFSVYKNALPAYTRSLKVFVGIY